MASSTRTIGVILAGGTGSRVGLAIPKQLLKIAGKAVMEHTLDVFADSEVIDEIFILMHPDHLDAAEAMAAKYPKVTRVLAGGETRNESTRAALAGLADRPADTKVLFHDAVRPLLEPRIINDLVDALDNFDAADVAIPSADTIIEVNEDKVITNIPDRSRLRRGQTPQAFRLGTLMEAYRIAFEDPNFVATDDCTVTLRYLPHVPITVVEGSDQNMKITEPIDVFIADKLFQIGSTVAPSSDPNQYAELLAGKVVVILGGSYGIGADMASLASGFGATVHSYSRSGTGTDVKDPEAIEAALAQAHAASGHIDYVVVTAGVLIKNRLSDSSMEEIMLGVEVNYLAPIVTARAALPYLKETGGQLLLFTSSSYTRGRAEYSIYSSSKAAVVNLTQALADEWAPEGIRVNVINPERTATPLRKKAFGDEPADSLLSSQAVALTAIDVLLSDLTGHVIDVRRIEPDGGARSRTELEARGIAAALSAAGTDSPDEP